MQNNQHPYKRCFDVVVFVATEDEKTAIKKETEKINQLKWNIEHTRNDSLPIETLLVKTGEGKILRLALQKLSAMGAEACVYNVLQFLHEHPCTLVTMVGICATDEEKAKIGDIIIPGKVLSISNGKKLDGKKLTADRPHTIDDHLKKAIANFKLRYWPKTRDEIQAKWPEKYNTPQDLHFEENLVMAQVFDVLAYSDSFSKLKSQSDRNILALDMESAALAYAASGNKWLVVKGAQDHANESKSNTAGPFCSWSSFITLLRIIEHSMDEVWDQKAKITELNERPEEYPTPDEIRGYYRAGDFVSAKNKGEVTFAAKQDDESFWGLYLRILVRTRKYDMALNVIDIADYYIDYHKKIEGTPTYFEYLVEKADYYRRIACYVDAQETVQMIIKAYKQDEKNVYKKTAIEAYYIKARIAVDKFKHDRNKGHLKYATDDLNVAKNIIYEMNKTDGNENIRPYWPLVLLLFVKRLNNDSHGIDLDKKIFDLAKDFILDHINEKPRRPAPRIYRIKLYAFKLATSTEKDFSELHFSELQETIKQDIEDCEKEKINLPEDFFEEFDSDCRLLFSPETERHYQDKVLSMIYYWASEVRVRN